MLTDQDFETAYLDNREKLKAYARRLIKPRLWSEVDDIVSDGFSSAWRHRENIKGPLLPYIIGAIRLAAITWSVENPSVEYEIRPEFIRDNRTPERLLIESTATQDAWSEIERKISSDDRKKLREWRQRGFVTRNPNESARLLSLRRRIEIAIKPKE